LIVCLVCEAVGGLCALLNMVVECCEIFDIGDKSFLTKVIFLFSVAS